MEYMAAPPVARLLDGVAELLGTHDVRLTRGDVWRWDAGSDRGAPVVEALSGALSRPLFALYAQTRTK